MTKNGNNLGFHVCFQYLYICIYIHIYVSLYVCVCVFVDVYIDSKESNCNAGDPVLIPGLGRSPGEGSGYPSSILPRESHGKRNLAGYSLWGCEELDMTE